MRVGAEIRGADAIAKRLAALGPRTTKAVWPAVVEGALAIQATAVRSILSQKGNRKETRYNPKRDVLVSPPGLPPNADTGRLAKSITVNLNSSTLTARIFTDLEYAPWLEYGTREMEPRPFMSPAYLRNRDEILRAIEAALAEAVDGV